MLLLGGCSPDASDQAEPGRPDLVLAHVSVIDGLGTAPIPDRTIEIRGGRITAIRPSAEDDEGLSLSGHFVAPGLIDTHQHLPAWDETLLLASLDSLVRAGITSVREMASRADVFQRVSERTDSAARPRLFWSAFWADSTFMADDPRVQDTPGAGDLPWSLSVNESTDLEAAVREARQSGATGIKVYTNIPPGLLRDIVLASHEQGMQVWSHPVVFPTRPSEVISAGSDVISHAALLVWEGAQQLPSTYNGGHPFNPFGPPAPYSTVAPEDPGVIAVLEAMLSRGVILDPTVSTMAGAVSAEASSWALRATRLAHEMGIPISVGTDNPAAGHTALFNELEMLVDSVGLTPLEALTSATSVGAAALGAEGELGSVQVGWVADLVVYSNDPTANITSVRYPAFVIKGGQIVSSLDGRQLPRR